MTIERLKDGELGKTGYMCGFGLAKEYASNWITVFLMNNTHKTLADVVKSPKYIGHKSGKFKSELTELGIEAEIEKEKGGIK